MFFFHSKNCLNTSRVLQFSKNNRYIMAAIRKSIYIYDAQIGSHIRTLNCHFGRIISLTSVDNKLISASIDKSIKVSYFYSFLCIYSYVKYFENINIK